MDMTESYASVLEVVRTWPPEQRFWLVQEVMKSLEPAFRTAHTRPQTADQALGLLATDQPAPSDEAVVQWLAEHRLEKCR